jgi:RimJ/RimL family protein N-acetyltransferase
VGDRPIEFPVEGLSDGVVRLRPMADADLAAVVAACQDPEIHRWTRVPNPYREAEARGWLSDQARKRAAGEGVELLIVDEADERLLGSVGAVRVDFEEASCELGYWVAREARGRGVATRAVKLLANWIFETLPIDRVQICAEPANDASRRVAERAGLTFEGVLRSYVVIKGRRRDMAMYSLLRTDVR